MANTARAKKGTVSVTSDRDRLRLGWRYKGERYFLFIGLPDTVTNRRVAEAKASQIELDMMSGHFDPTLRAYKLQLPSRSHLTVTGLFNKFIQHKSKTVVWVDISLRIKVPPKQMPKPFTEAEIKSIVSQGSCKL